jgi:proline iminopeptidase
MKRIVILLVAALVMLLAVAGAFFWYWVGKPMYEPGMVRSGQNLRASLMPPKRLNDESFWRVENDIQLHHFAEGAGKTVLVIHGGPGYPFSDPLPGLAPLTNNYKFIYYDQRGCGKSSKPFVRFSSSNYYENMQTLEKTLGIGAQVADIERIRRILGEEKLVILGHSFGALLASMYAAEFPENIQALILVAPADVLVMPAEDGGLYEEVGRLLPDKMKQEYATFQNRYFNSGNIFSKSETELAALNREFVKYYVAAAQRENAPVQEAGEMQENGGYMTFATYFSMGRRHDYRGALKQVTAPVLVIHGENDLQPEKASRMYADVFPNSKFQVIKNADHFAFNEQPEEFSRVVREFLSQAK